MKVTAKEFIDAGWVDMDCGAPYHIETHPIGHDRKIHEGPFETNEDFPSTWMPTKEKIEPPCGCEEGGLAKEDLDIEKIVVHVHGEAEAFPWRSESEEVPISLFRAWIKAHKSVENYDGDPSDAARMFEAVEDLADFIEAAQLIGVRRMYDPAKIRKMSKEPTIPRPYALDSILNSVHEDVMQHTLTHREDWYRARDREEGRTRPDPGFPTWHEEHEEPFVPPPSRDEGGPREPKLTPQELRERRGPAAPFLEEMWERRKRHGMRITAAEVLRFDPSRRRLKEPPKRKPFSETLQGPFGLGPFPKFQEPAKLKEEEPAEATPYTDINEYDEILYLYDGIPTMLGDYINPMVKAMQDMPPEQKTEIGRLIRNIQRAIQVLGQ